MVNASPADRLCAKEIMIAYISALGNNAPRLFRKDGHETPTEKDFAETWETILKTILAHK